MYRTMRKHLAKPPVLTVTHEGSFTRIVVGKGRYTTGLPATMTKALKRYTSGMTVGHGFYSNHISTDQVGARLQVNGFWDDGRVGVALPVGGSGVIGSADIEPDPSWPPELLAEFRALPRRSMIDADGEMLDERGDRMFYDTRTPEGRAKVPR